MKIHHHETTWSKGTLIDGAQIGYWEYYHHVNRGNLKSINKVFLL